MKKYNATLFLLTTLLASLSTTALSNAYGAENPNQFNRLFTPPKERITTLEADGIHDPEVSGLKLLQQPTSAFKPLEPSTKDNYVD